jgi:uncharacterized protein with HEPN domain
MVFLQRITKDRTLEDLIHDDYFSHAVRSAIEVIGEASKNLSQEIRVQYPAIGWKRMSQTRDRIIHRYFDINWQIVWDLITIEIPVIEPKISAIIRDLERDSSL